jgi:cell division protein FtsI/penicillin-binding protein 2
MLIPKILTIIFVLVSLLLTTLLMWAAWRHRNPSANLNPPEEVKELGTTATNRWLRGLRVFLMLLMIAVLGLHAYWVFRAASDPNFEKAKRQDARNRRLAESGLKGWVLDRTGKLENSLIRYRSDAGVITRDYPLGAAAVHITGYSDFILGSGGFEHAFRDWLNEPVSTLNQLQSPTPVGKDLTVTIDGNFQAEAFKLLQATGKPAAAVVLLLPNNEVLAMASAPSFDPRVINNEAEWQKLNDQVEDALPLSPLVNRALGTLVTGGPAFYYRPGSTFKTFIAAVAIDCGVTEEQFTCKGGGFTPPGSGRAINDFAGEVHGTIGLQEAFKVSCNQYFSQLGLKVGRDRLANYAKRLHFSVSPDEKISRAQDLWHIEHGELTDFNFIFAPPVHKMNLSRTATDYDIALQSIGQGYTDLTVMEMAVIAATAASADGAYVSPAFEVGGQRKVVNEFIKPQSAERLRAFMKLVVQPGGTAAGAFAGRISAAGKTGTADRDVLVYDRSGKPVIDYTDKEGRIHYKYTGLTDSWFIGFAPADNPQIAFAVMIENGGQGARSAAPIAAKLIEKAQALGYVRSTPNALPVKTTARKQTR